MAREYLDWSVFDTPGSAMELLENSVRKGVTYDAYGEQKVWKAMVLSPARRIDSTEGAGLGVAAKPDSVAINSPMYRFKVRLLGENSPHMLIPDPCDLALNADPRYVEAIIEQHLDVVFVKSGQVDPPNRGDIILVEMQKNDMSYDLQKADFIRTIARNISAETFLSTKGCALTYDVFDDLDLYVDSPIPSGGGYTEFAPVSESIIISKEISNFIGELRKKLSKDQIRIVYITSGVRSPEAQARAISAKRTLHKCETGIAGRPPPDHACYPIYNLYKNKELIIEALRVPNTVQAMTNVFQRQISNKKYLSRHMRGLGIDLRVTNLSAEQMQLLQNAVETTGGNYAYEGDPPHIHIGISGGTGLASSAPPASESGSGESDSA